MGQEREPFHPEVPLESPIDTGMFDLPEPSEPEDPVAQAIQDAAARGNVDIYLQPILSLDDRKVRFFEVLGRIHGAAGEVIATEEHADIARQARVADKLDRAILARTARLLHKLSERRQAQPLFCNVSRESLSDANFARDIVDGAGGFRAIAPFMIFEVDQATLATGSRDVVENLRTLTSLGFRLSIDQVTNVEQALSNGRELGASFLKLTYGAFLPSSQSVGDAHERAQTIYSVARDSGMTVVVDKIERKDQLAGVVGAGVNLGQGYLFSEPKPLLPQVAAEVADASAAA